jgi:hypothetical protein
MAELPPSNERIILQDDGGVLVYSEPYLDGTVLVAECEFSTLRVYLDGSRSYTHRKSGTITTYYPDNTFTLDEPGEPTIHGKTRFNVVEDTQP